ncbi:MAG: hypothetical protein EOM26_07840, partial [Alphaproteobacteria bacterium]|nr:hypothetical protein [Alphaproteobacteria bacterium]
FVSQLFWLAVAFLVLYLWFSRKTLPEISGVLENRREHIQSDLDTADRLTREAEQVQEMYEKSLEKAREQAARIIADMDESLKVRTSQTLGSFRERADREIAMAESRISRAKSAAMAQVNVIAAEVAGDVAARIADISVDQKDALRAVENLVNRDGERVA